MPSTNNIGDGSQTGEEDFYVIDTQPNSDYAETQSNADQADDDCQFIDHKHMAMQMDAEEMPEGKQIW